MFGVFPAGAVGFDESGGGLFELESPRSLKPSLLAVSPSRVDGINTIEFQFNDYDWALNGPKP